MDLDALFRAYAPYVAAVALRLLGRDDEVDDVVQEVFVEAVRGIGALRAPDAAKGWLATVAVRAARRRLRRRRMWTWLGLGAEVDYDELVADGASPEQHALLARVYAMLDRLPVDQRIAWTLRYVEGERLDAVARLCGCSLATAKRWIAAAQAVLTEELSGG